MTRLALALVAVTVVTAAAPAALATPLDLHRVPIEAHGVGHLDVDALRKTSFYGPLDLANQVTKALDELGPVGEKIVTSCAAVTLWVGDKLPPKQNGDPDRQGAVMLEFPHGSKLADEILDLAAIKMHGKKTGDRYTIAMDKGTYLLAVVGDVLVFTDDPPSMTKTIAVLQGKGKTVSDKALPASDHGVFLFAGLDDSLLKDAKNDATAAVFKTDLKSLVIDVAQVGGDLRGRAVALLGTADDAQKVKSVLDGLVALVSLSAAPSEAKELAKHVEIKANGTSVSASLAVPVSELIAAVKAVK